jgi:hypothetical protein
MMSNISHKGKSVRVCGLVGLRPSGVCTRESQVRLENYG